MLILKTGDKFRGHTVLAITRTGIVVGTPHGSVPYTQSEVERELFGNA